MLSNRPAPAPLAVTVTPVGGRVPLLWPSGGALLATFPCLAVPGEALVERPGVRPTARPAGGAGPVVLTAVFGTGYDPS